MLYYMVGSDISFGDISFRLYLDYASFNVLQLPYRMVLHQVLYVTLSGQGAYICITNSNNYSFGNHFFKVLVQIHYSHLKQPHVLLCYR